MLVQLGGALVLVEQGEAKLLDLLEVVVHLELHPEHRVQVVHGGFSAAELNNKTQGERERDT